MNRPIRSIHIIGSKGSGGAENFYVRLVKALNEHGHPAIAINPPGSYVAEAIDDSTTQYHPAMRSVYDFISRWQINKIIKQEQPDIVQTYMGRATRLTHVKNSIHVARLGGYYNLKGYRHAHAWVGNTRGIQQYLVENSLPDERCFYVGNFVDLPEQLENARVHKLKQELCISEDSWVLVSVGRLHPNKGYVDLLDAFTKLSETINQKPVHLVIVGDGPLKNELVTHVQPLNIHNRLHWVGWQNDTTPYYKLADIFVCPSRHEPLGNVILEAWAHEVPVVSTNTDGAVELIEDKHNGWLTPCEDPGKLANAIQSLLEADDTQKQALINKGKETLLAEHSVQHVVEQYITLYQKLVEQS